MYFYYGSLYEADSLCRSQMHHRTTFYNHDPGLKVMKKEGVHGRKLLTGFFLYLLFIMNR
jgi:hypothetical protein